MNGFCITYEGLDGRRQAYGQDGAIFLYDTQQQAEAAAGGLVHSNQAYWARVYPADELNGTSPALATFVQRFTTQEVGGHRVQDV
jgi:hypothetical protein